jgi:Transcription elongation factor, GreA/GreB, C-term.
VYSPTSPLGTAVLGTKVGDTVSYELANGKSMKVQVCAPSPTPASRIRICRLLRDRNRRLVAV